MRGRDTRRWVLASVCVGRNPLTSCQPIVVPLRCFVYALYSGCKNGIHGTPRIWFLLPVHPVQRFIGDILIRLHLVWESSRCLGLGRLRIYAIIAWTVLLQFFSRSIHSIRFQTSTTISSRPSNRRPSLDLAPGRAVRLVRPLGAGEVGGEGSEVPVRSFSQPTRRQQSRRA